VEKPKGKRPLVNPWSAWKNNIKMDLKVRGWKVLNRGRGQDVKTVINFEAA
jgi:hypothetical protein